MNLVEINKLHDAGRLLGRCALIKATHHSAEYGVEGGMIISWDRVAELGIAIHGRLDDSFFLEHRDIAAVVDGLWELDEAALTIGSAEILQFALDTNPDTEVDPRASAALARVA